MRRLVFSCLLISGVACQLAPLDVEGLRCVSDDECEGLSCVRGVCAVQREMDAGVDAGLDAGHDAGVDAGHDAGFIDAGEPDAGPIDAGIPLYTNLLANPGFEQLSMDGGVNGWKTSNARLVTETQIFRSGRRSGRLTAGMQNTGPTVLPVERVTNIGSGMGFCAGIYARTDRNNGMEVTLSLRNYLADGTVNTISGGRTMLGNSWVQLTKAVPTFAGSSLEMRLVISGQDAGMNLYVDDATLLRTDNDGCL